MAGAKDRSLEPGGRQASQQRHRRPGPAGQQRRRQTGRPGDPDRVRRPEIVGRDEEFGRLIGLLNRAPTERAQFLLIEGEAGIGKSTLVDAFAEEAGQRGYRLLRARADDLTRRQSFALIGGCLGANWLLPPPTWPDGDPTVRSLADRGAAWTRVELQASEETIAVVETLCASSPVAVVLDDLHWSDAASLFVLRTLIRHVASLPLVLLGTMRPVPRSEELAGLVADFGPRQRLALGPLDDAAVVALSRSSTGSAPGPRLQQQLALAGGNPLFVLEMLDTLDVDGSLRQVAGPPGSGPIAEVERVETPPSLAMMLLHHLSFLPAETLWLLRVASILGVGFRPAHLAALTGRNMAELMAPLAEASTAGLLHDVGEELRFRHELVREALYGDLPLGVRSELHRDAARALAERGAAPSLVAEHLMRGAEPGDEAAARTLGEAARRIAVEAPATATDLLEQAIAIAPPASPIVPALRGDLAVALLWSGRSLDGEAMCRIALAQVVEPGQRSALRQCLVESLLTRGQPQAVLDEAARTDAVLDLGGRAGLGTDDGWLNRLSDARLGGIVANALLFLDRLDEAEALALQMERLGAESGDAEATVQAQVVRTLLAERRGAVDSAIDLGSRAVATTEADGSRQAYRRLAHLAQAMMLMDVDRFGQATALLQRAAEVQESFGAQDAVALLHIGLGFVRFWAGSWDEAEVELDTGIALAEETGVGWRAAARALRAVVALGRGQSDAAEQGLQLARRELAAGDAGYRVEWLDWATALWHLTAGDQVAAACRVRPAARRWASGQGSPTITTVGPTAVCLLALHSPGDLAGPVVEMLARLARSYPGWLGVEAAATAAGGYQADNPDSMARAAAIYRQAGRPLEAALATEEAAVRLASTGRSDEAHRLLHEAVAGYVGLGATTFVTRATRRVGTGTAAASDLSTRPTSGTEARPTFGWESLTPAEMRVLRLVAERRSNPDIARLLAVSRRTVETHVSHIFAKVGVSSRSALATEATKHFGWRLRLE